MCGILGIIKREEESPFPLRLERALGALHHRGPDAQGYFTDAHIYLGHTRLAIIDLSIAGQQPMRSRDGRFYIVHNGEVYNFQEIRAELERGGVIFRSRTDTEVILESYARWGEDCLRRFRGMFAFAIWDAQEKRFFAARDRCGEKPFLYVMNDEYIVFASELKALVPLLASKPELDPAMVDMYLHYQYTPEPYTLLKGVRKLAAAHSLTVSASTWAMDQKQYWSLTSDHGRHDVSASCVKEAVRDAVTATLVADVPIGLGLSGGIDSGTIAALAVQCTDKPVHAFSIGYPGRPPYDERAQAKKLASQLGLVFHEVEIPPHEAVSSFVNLVRMMDEPIADPAAYAHSVVFRAAAAAGVKVLLSGIGGDELFWGYPWTVHAVKANVLRAQCQWLPPFVFTALGRALHTPLAQRLGATQRLPSAVTQSLSVLSKIFTPDAAYAGRFALNNLLPDYVAAGRFGASVYGEALLGLPANNARRPFDRAIPPPEEIPEAVLQALFDTWLVSNCLSLGDRLAMFYGVESRCPFLDHVLVERVMSLRRVTPDHTLGQKAWLKQAVRGTLPEEVLQRPKQGFQPPIVEWLGSVNRLYADAVYDGQLAALGMVNTKALQDRQGSFSKGYSGVFYLYKLCLLEQWFAMISATYESPAALPNAGGLA